MTPEQMDESTELVDIGYEVSPGGQKSHQWIRPCDVAAYIREREEAACKQERERCLKIVRHLFNMDCTCSLCVKNRAILDEIADAEVTEVREENKQWRPDVNFTEHISKYPKLK